MQGEELVKEDVEQAGVQDVEAEEAEVALEDPATTTNQQQIQTRKNSSVKPQT